MFFYLMLVLLVLQRVGELVYALRNESFLRSQGAIEFDSKGYYAIAAMHTAFIISLPTEKIIMSRELNPYWIALIIALALAQILRYWAITSLGIYWNTKILVSPQHRIIAEGPYKYLSHPNYIAVVTEIAVIPLIFSCYYTAAVFSVLNMILLGRRIKLEEKALKSVSVGKAGIE